MESTLLGVDPLGDGISKVTCLNLMGDDLTVVNAARVSFSKTSYWHDDDELKEQDAKLIKYLAAHKHWTPFSQPQIQFRIKMPIFVARQWYKSSVGFTRNEVSRRYVDDPPEFFVPPVWRARPEGGIKQGSSDDEVDLEVTITFGSMKAYCVQAARAYNELLKAGVCPEMARMVLPQSMYTEFVEVGSLAAYARLYSLRSSEDAQKETRDYANSVGIILRTLFPHSWAALTEVAPS
jgi:thymidylate synthase (FAD)